MGGHERAGVKAAVALHAARDQNPGKRLVGRQLEERVVLVVAQQDVVSGRALLDQVVFERERLHHRVGDDHLEADDLVEQRVGLGIRTVGAQIVPHPVAQHPRLADVNRVTTLVEVQIDPGLLGQPANLFLEFVDGHTII